jgi:hypothetical protein
LLTADEKLFIEYAKLAASRRHAILNVKYDQKKKKLEAETGSEDFEMKSDKQLVPETLATEETSDIDMKVEENAEESRKTEAEIEAELLEEVKA